MVKCIAGLKGSGKTKQLISFVNDAVKDAKGNVVCLEAGQKLTYDIVHEARLIDVLTYNVSGYDALYYFICGIHASNYDVSTIAVDSLNKLVDIKNADKLIDFFEKVDEFATIHNVKFTICISAEKESLPKEILKYVI